MSLSSPLARRRLATKFGLILAPLLIAFAVLLVSYLSSVNERLKTTALEIQGTEYLTPQMVILQELQAHKIQSEKLIMVGDKNLKRLAPIAEKIDAEFNWLTQNLPATWPLPVEKLKNIRSDWTEFQSNNLSLSITESRARHLELTRQMIYLVRLIADASNLTTDPDLQTHYLISSVHFTIPLLVKQIEDMGTELATMAANASVNPKTIGKASAQLESIELLIGELQSSLAKSREAGLELDAGTQQQADLLPGHLENMKKLVKGLETMIILYTSFSVVEEVQTYVQTVRDLQISLLENLRRGLQDRTSRLQADLIFELGKTSLVLLLAILTGTLIFRAIGQQVKRLVKQAGSLAESNLQTASVLDGQHEFAVISQAIEKVRLSQIEMVKHLSGSAGSLNATQSVLDSASHAFTESASIQQNHTRNFEKSVETLTNGMSEVSRCADQAREIAQETATVATLGCQSMQMTWSTITEMAESSQNLVTQIQSLHKQSESISSIIQTIEQIAGQTNLLALNAAIEAARAGENGRGFAVVADEVRLLSEQTASSTRNISTLVGNIQNTTSVAVHSVNAWKEKVEQTLEVAQKANESVQEIGGQCAQTQASIADINHFVSEQAAAAACMKELIHEINRMADSNREIAQRLESVNQQNESVSESLNGLARSFKCT